MLVVVFLLRPNTEKNINKLKEIVINWIEIEVIIDIGATNAPQFRNYIENNFVCICNSYQMRVVV